MELDSAQQQVLDQFKDITDWQGSTEDAVALLNACSWNLETAIVMHLDGGTSTPVPQVPVAPQGARRILNMDDYEYYNDYIPHGTANAVPVAPRIGSSPTIYQANGTSGSFIQTFLLAPFNIGYKMFNTLLYFLSWVFPFFPRLTGYYPANRNATLAETAKDPKSTAIRYIRWFEETYKVDLTNDTDSHSQTSSVDSSSREPNSPPVTSSSTSSNTNTDTNTSKNRIVPFYEDGYTDALETATKELKYLVVYLQSDEHDDSDRFNRQVLLNPQVSALLNRDDVIFWAGTVKESEAYLVSSGLEVTKFPFIGVIAPTPKTQTSNSVVMTVLLRIQGCGKLSADQFVSLVEEKLELHAPKLMALVFDRQEREASRRIVEEQNSAYERSLAADRLREQQRREAQEEEERKQRLARELERKKGQWKKYHSYMLLKKLRDAEHNTKQNVTTTRLSIRLLNGERMLKRFNGDDTIGDLYAFVECYNEITELEQELEQVPEIENENDTELPEDYEHEYKFQLASPYPKKVLVDMSMPIKDEPVLWPTGAVLVEEKEDEED